jgi:hypothetical protein
MAERHQIEIIYRGRSCMGEWYVEDGKLHVISSLGSKSGPAVGRNPRALSLPSELAAQMLWDLARAADPKRPFFDWR